LRSVPRLLPAPSAWPSSWMGRLSGRSLPVRDGSYGSFRLGRTASRWLLCNQTARPSPRPVLSR